MIKKIKTWLKIFAHFAIIIFAVFSVTLKQNNVNLKFAEKVLNYQKTNLNNPLGSYNNHQAKKDIYLDSVAEMNALNERSSGWDSYSINGHDADLIPSEIFYDPDFKVSGTASPENKRVGQLGDAELGFSMKMKINNTWSNTNHYSENAYGKKLLSNDENFYFNEDIPLSENLKIIFNVNTPDYSGYQVSGSSINFNGGTLNDKLQEAYQAQYALAKKFINSDEWKNNKTTKNKASKWNISVYLKQIHFDKLSYYSYDDDGWGDSSVDSFKFSGISFDIGWCARILETSIQEKIYNKKIFISSYELNNTNWSGTKLESLLTFKNSTNQKVNANIKSIQLDKENKLIKLDVAFNYQNKKFKRTILKVPIHIYSLNYLVSVSKNSSQQWEHIAMNNKKYHTSPPITQLEISSNFLKSLRMFTKRKQLIKDIQKGKGWSSLNNANKNNLINKVNSFAINYFNINEIKKAWNANNHINLNNVTPPSFINKYLNGNNWDESTSWSEYLLLFKKANFFINSSAIVTNPKIALCNFKYQDIKSKGKIQLSSDDIAKNGSKTIWEMKVNNLRIQNQEEKIIGNEFLNMDKPIFNLEKTDLNIKYDVSKGHKAIIHKYFYQAKPIDISDDVSFTLMNGTVLDKNFLIASGKDKGQPGWTAIRYLYNDGTADKRVLLQKVKDKYYVPELKEWITVLDPSFDKEKIEYIFNDDVQMIINPYDLNGQKIGAGVITGLTIKKYGISKVEDKFNGETKILEDWNDGKWSHSHNDKGAILDGLFGVDLNGYADGKGRLGIGTHAITIYLQNQGPIAFKHKYKLIVDKSINKLKVLPVERKLGIATIQVKPSNYLLWSKNKIILDVESSQNGFILKDKRVNAEWISQKEFYIKINNVNSIKYSNKIWFYDENYVPLFCIKPMSYSAFAEWKDNIGKYLKVKAPNVLAGFQNEKRSYLNKIKNLKSQYQAKYYINDDQDKAEKITNLHDWNIFYPTHQNIKITAKLSSWKKWYKNYVLKEYNKLSNYDLDQTYAQLEAKINNCKTFAELRKLRLNSTPSGVEYVNITEQMQKTFASGNSEDFNQILGLSDHQYDGYWWNDVTLDNLDNEYAMTLDIDNASANYYNGPNYLFIGPDGYKGEDWRNNSVSSDGLESIKRIKEKDFSNWHVKVTGAFDDKTAKKLINKELSLYSMNALVKKWIKNNSNKIITKIEATFGNKYTYAEDGKVHFRINLDKLKIHFKKTKVNFYWPWKATTNDPKTKKINYDYGNYLQSNNYNIIQTPLSSSQEQEFPIYFSNGSIKFVMYDVDIKSIQADLLASDGKWYQIPIDIKIEELDGKYYKVINSTINYAGFARVQIADQANNSKTFYFKLSPNSKSVVPDLMFKTKDVIKVKGIPKNWMGQKITFINPSSVLSIDPLVTDINIKKFTLNQNGYINKTNVTKQEVAISDYHQKVETGYAFGSTIGKGVLKYAGDELKPFLRKSDGKLGKWTLKDKKMDFKKPGLYQVILKTRLSSNPVVKQFIYVKPSNEKDFLNEDNVPKENTNFVLGNNLNHSKSIKNQDKSYSTFKEYKLDYWPFLIKKAKVKYSYLWYSDFFKINVTKDLLLIKEGKYKITLTTIFGNTFSHKILVLNKSKTLMERKTQKISLIAKNQDKVDKWSAYGWIIDLKNLTYIKNKNNGTLSKTGNGRWIIHGYDNLVLIQDKNGKLILTNKKDVLKTNHKFINQKNQWIIKEGTNTILESLKGDVLVDASGNKKILFNTLGDHFIAIAKGKFNLLVKDKTAFWKGKKVWNSWRWVDQDYNQKAYEYFKKIGLQKGLTLKQINDKWKKWNKYKDWNGKWETGELITQREKWSKNKLAVKVVDPFENWTFNLGKNTYAHKGNKGTLIKIGNGKWDVNGFKDLTLIQNKDGKLILVNKTNILKTFKNSLGKSETTSILSTFKDAYIFHDKDGNTLVIDFKSYSILTKNLSGDWISKKTDTSSKTLGSGVTNVKEDKKITQGAAHKIKSKWPIGIGVLGSLLLIGILVFIKKRWKLKKIK